MKNCDSYLVLLPISALKIDNAYQRELLSGKYASRLKKDFNWDAFGAIVVSKRPNGDYYVVDGQQRVEAAKQNGLTHVPCVVRNLINQAHEAEIFVQTATFRKKISAVTKFHASVVAGREPETTIENWLAQKGFSVKGGNCGEKVLTFIASFQRSWEIHRESAEKSFNTLVKITDDTPHGDLFLGLWWLFRNNIPANKFMQKWEDLGQGGIVKKIRQFCVLGGFSVNASTAGRAMLLILNKGLTKKFKPNTETAEQECIDIMTTRAKGI